MEKKAPPPNNGKTQQNRDIRQAPKIQTAEGLRRQRSPIKGKNTSKTGS